MSEIDINPEVVDELESLAAESEKSLEVLKQQYLEKRESNKERLSGVMGEEELIEATLNGVRADLQFQARTTGEVEELDIFALGHHGTMDWEDRDNGGEKEVVIALGIVAPDDKPDENRPAGVAAFICDETDGVDLGNIRKRFEFGNHLAGWFSIRKNDDFSDRKRTYYLGNCNDETKVEEVELDLPTEPDDQCEFVRQYVPEESDVTEIASNLSREGDNFGTSWLDMRRVTGQVVDAYRDRDSGGRGTGIFRVIDSSVSGPEELERLPYMTDEDVEKGRTPGLNVWIPPEFVECGRESTIELIGDLSKNPETGQISMNAVAAIPHIPYPYEDNSNGDGGDHDDVEAESL